MSKLRYGIIDPKSRTCSIAEFATFEDALAAASLRPGEIDFGQIAQGLAIVVYEYGLFAAPDQTAYFAIDGRLYAGASVIYAVDDAGNTITLPSKKFPVDVRFFDDAAAVVTAIEMEEVRQPSISVGSEVIWVWPQPAPAGMMREEKRK